MSKALSERCPSSSSTELTFHVGSAQTPHHLASVPGGFWYETNIPCQSNRFNRTHLCRHGITQLPVNIPVELLTPSLLLQSLLLDHHDAGSVSACILMIDMDIQITC